MTLVSVSPGLPLFRRGKVREMYVVDDDRLLMVASDRVSAFDVVMDQPIPGKGEVLTALSAFWFHKTADLVPNHLLSDQAKDLPSSARDTWRTCVRASPPIPRISDGGSGWGRSCLPMVRLPRLWRSFAT